MPSYEPRARFARPRGSAVLLALLAGLLATGVFARDATQPLRVGTSGDYPPFSETLEGGGLGGFDVAVAQAYARERGLALEWVRFRWPDLLDDLDAGRFDVAMSGVTVRPERSVRGRFTLAVAETGALVLTRNPPRGGLEGLDSHRVRIGVNAGGHLERVARAHFPEATLVAIPANAAVPKALAEGSVDAVITDTAEAPLWEAEVKGLQRLGPITRDRKAFLVRAERADLAIDLDAWLLLRESDGTLAGLRSEYLGAAEPATAGALPALLAAVDERLSLMPLVGIVKRRTGVPLEVPEREDLVLDTAAATVLEAAQAADVRPPSYLTIRGFFRAQIEAAKRVQRMAVKDPSLRPEPPLPDLEATLRPALLRIGDRIARIVVALPPGIDRDAVRAAADAELRAPYVRNASRREIADALAELVPAAPGRAED